MNNYGFATANLANFFQYFLEKYSKKKFGLLLVTNNAIIKGTPLKYLSSKEFKKLDFASFYIDHSKFIDWYNACAAEDAESTNIFIKPLIPIESYDIVIMQNATLYSSGKIFKVPSHIVFSDAIISMSIIPLDYEPE